MTSYIGNPPVVSATRTVTEVIATAGQTVFTANGGYTVGYVDVSVNGVELQSFDFTATDGSTITLAVGCAAGDEVRIVAYGTFQLSSALPTLNPSYTGTLTGGTGIINIGSGQFYKDASGNVGIGTSSPGHALQVTRAGIAAYVANTDGTGTVISGVNGSGLGVYGTFSNTAMALFTNSTERARIGSDGSQSSVIPGGSVLYPEFKCRAWVNFNGTGTVAIRASGNVSSITDNGVGDYTVNFATAMPDANYIGASSGNWDSAVRPASTGPNATRTKTASAYPMIVMQHTTYALFDTSEVNVAIFR